MTALCSLPAADLVLAIPASGMLEVHYGPMGNNAYALIVGDTLSMVSPLKRCVTDGTADAAHWRTVLSALTDAATVTVYEADGVFSLTDAADVSEADTKPTKPVVPQKTDAPVPTPDLHGMPQIKPLPGELVRTFSSALPATSTYAVVDGILTLAELFTHGGAQVRHNALERSWDIRTSQRTAYRVQVTGTAAELTSYLRTAHGWQAVETLCLPPLPLHEQFRLFYGRKQS